MDISIVIPAFDERNKIAADIKAASAFLVSNRLTGEIIVVDDGSGDDTAEVAGAVEVIPPISLKVIRLPGHRGKGCAIRTGVGKSSGEYVMFADSGCCVPYAEALHGLELLKNHACDIAHGSRKLQQSMIIRPQNWRRRIYSRIFRLLINAVMKIGSEFTDTQCGFKIYRGDVARNLYSQCITDGFIFDVEIIMLAKKQGLRVKEFPIEWTCDRDSRLSPSQNIWHILLELITIRRTL